MSLYIARLSWSIEVYGFRFRTSLAVVTEPHPAFKNIQREVNDSDTNNCVRVLGGTDWPSTDRSF